MNANRRMLHDVVPVGRHRRPISLRSGAGGIDLSRGVSETRAQKNTVPTRNDSSPRGKS